MTEQERADAQAKIAATPWGWSAMKARQWRWRRFIVQQGGKGLRTFARDDFLRDGGFVHLFDEAERGR